MNVLQDGKMPRVLSLKDLLQNYINHGRNILIRRSNYRLKNIDTRLHLIEGFLVTYLNIDRVINIIRFNEKPKSDLQEEFDLSEIQAEAILNMRLRSLRKLEQFQLEEEKDLLLNLNYRLFIYLGNENPTRSCSTSRDPTPSRLPSQPRPSCLVSRTFTINVNN